MARIPSFAALLLALAVVPGCLVVDRRPLNELISRADAGGMPDVPAPPEDVPVTPDAPPAGPADHCGDPSAEVLIMGGAHDVDTTMMDPDISLLGMPTPGNDAFFQFEATSGEFWHFHLAALSAGRNPVLYIVQAVGGVCASSTMFVRNACSGEGDEHFAFVAPSTGTFWVAVDDGLSGGGRYRLQVVRPVCGNGIQEHGEPCDEGSAGTATCTSTCKIILSDVGGTGMTSVPPARHNDTAAEAMIVEVPDPLLDVSGSIPPGDCYPDVFAVDIAMGQRLTVTARNTTTGLACAAAAEAEYTLELQNAAGTRIAGGVDAMGCPTVNQVLMNEGRYFVWLHATGDGTRPVNYTLRFETTP